MVIEMEPRVNLPLIADTNWETITLPNGLRVILALDQTTPLVHLNLWYHVGSKNERQGSTGFAHLIEHLMFQKSTNAPNDYVSSLEQVGGTANGTTDEDRTEFIETIPAGALDYALWLEADRLATFRDALTRDNLEIQKAVIANERQQMQVAENDGAAELLIREHLFPTGHPYSHPILGFPDDVHTASVEHLREFFTRYYAPNNLSLVIAGNFNSSNALTSVSKYFRGIPPAVPIARTVRWVPQLPSEKCVEFDDSVASTRAYRAWPVPPYLSAEEVQLEFAAGILERRLNAALVHNQAPLCSDIRAHVCAKEDVSIFKVAATLHSGASIREAERSVDAVISLLSKEGPDEEEIGQRRRRAEFDHISQFDTLQSIASTLNRCNVLGENPSYYVHRQKQIAGVRYDDVVSVMRRYISTQGCLRIRARPHTARADTMSLLDRSVAPVIVNSHRICCPRISSTKLPNGLEVVVAPQSNARKVSVLLVTRAGSVFDPQGKEGLATITGDTMLRGTIRRSGTQIRDDMESAGASGLVSSVSADGASLGFDVLAPNLGRAVEIFADLSLYPGFRNYSTDSSKQKLYARVCEAECDTAQIAGNVASALAFGNQHCLARPFATREGIGSLDCSDLSAFYQSHWKPGGSALIFAGNIAAPEAFRLARQHFGTWEGRTCPMLIPPPGGVEAGPFYLVDMPNAVQSLIVQILPLANVVTSDRFALLLADYIWGRMSDSRLNRSIREGLGYTYDCASLLHLFPGAGAWLAYARLQADKTKQCIIELQRQLALLNEYPISQAELDAAKRSNEIQLALGSERPSGLAGRIGQLWIGQLPISDVTRQSELMERLTLQDVRTALVQYAVPSKAIILLVGDQQRIEGSLHDPAVGAVIAIDKTGRALN
jgi:zinc protease